MKVPSAPSAAGSAVLTALTVPKNGSVRLPGRSASVGTCCLGTTSTCPLNTGRASRKATVWLSANTVWAAVVPAAMAQNVHSVTLAR